MTSAPSPEAGSWDQPRWRCFRAAVLVLFVLLAYSYVWVVQPLYGPDEPRHFMFVKRLVDRGRLPLQVNGQEADGAHSLHPPLYYVLVSPVYMLTRSLSIQDSDRAIKHLSPLILLAALFLFLQVLRRLFTDRPFTGAAALAVVALLPEFQLEASVMNNDSLAIFMGALFIWWLVRTWDAPPSLKTGLLAGLIMAAFANTKPTGWSAAPLWALAVGIRAWRSPERQRGRLQELIVSYALLFLLGTWWYIRNYKLYGVAVPIEMDWHGGATRPRDPVTGAILTPLQVYTSGMVVTLGWRAVVGMFQSYWSQVDWIEGYETEVWTPLLLIMLAAGLGWAIRAVRVFPELRKDGLPGLKSRLTPLLLLTGGLAVVWLSNWYVATFVHLGFYQGSRYLMPFSFAAGALLAAGWETILPPRVRFPAALALVVGFLAFNGLCLYNLVNVLNPRYVH